MFGHQDEPKQQTPTDNPEPASNGTLDDSPVITPVAPDNNGAVTPLLDEHAEDGAATADTAAAEPVSAPDLTLPSTDGTPAPDTNTLLDIKQQALQQLSPLVGHLDQSPEEKFRTTMMMIQASDNQDLVKTAYESAQAITDEKARAQALLDIVNEINYFTQHQND